MLERWLLFKGHFYNGFSYYTPVEFTLWSICMTSNFVVNDPDLMRCLQHIIAHPADPLYNSFILNGDEISGGLILAQLYHNLSEKYPEREILYLQEYDILEFIRARPHELLMSYHRLHPNLFCVLLAGVELTSLNKTEQDKLALFLKYLTKQNIQVVVSTSLVTERSFSDCSTITPEVWSWYMSGRDYETSRCKTIYTKDLSAALTIEQDKKRLKLFSLFRKSYHFGELYPGILEKDGKNIDRYSIQLGICWLGSYEPPQDKFPKAICPRCQKTALRPYSCIASPLSGRHVIKFYCYNCRERIATNNALDYYQLLRTYGTRKRYRVLPQEGSKKGE